MIIKLTSFLIAVLSFSVVNAGPSNPPDFYEDPYQHYDPAFTFHGQETILHGTPPFETMEIGGYFEIDGHFFVGHDQPKPEFYIRTARFFLAGELYDQFGFLFMPEFDSLTGVRLAYAWLETLYPKWARLRVGEFKQPFSLEALKSILFRTFNGISLPIRNYCFIHDIGIMLYGKVFDNTISYSLACMNGRRAFAQEIDDSPLSIIGRVVAEVPLFRSSGELYLGLSLATGQIKRDLTGDPFITETETPFWLWLGDSDNPVINSGRHNRIGGDIEWLSGPLSFCAEYIYTEWGKIKHGGRSASFTGYGGYAEISYLLTGEKKPRGSQVAPLNNFQFHGIGWGAWEVAFRYEAFYASQKMIDLGFAKGANRLHGPMAGLNWYLNDRIAIKLDGQYLWFNRPFVNDGRTFSYEGDLILRIQGIF